MMPRIHFKPSYLMGMGFVGVVLGVLLPFLIILKILPSTYFWNFLAYAVSVAGLVLGVVGAAWQTRIDRAKRRFDE